MNIMSAIAARIEEVRQRSRMPSDWLVYCMKVSARIRDLQDKVEQATYLLNRNTQIIAALYEENGRLMHLNAQLRAGGEEAIQELIRMTVFRGGDNKLPATVARFNALLQQS